MSTLTTRASTRSAAENAARGAMGALIELHRALLAHAFFQHEQAHEVRLAPLERLHLATTDAAFAWLRPMSELIVELDELLDAPRSDPGELVAFRTEIERLTAASDDPTSIGARLRALLDTEVTVAASYAALERELSRIVDRRLS